MRYFEEFQRVVKKYRTINEGKPPIDYPDESKVLAEFGLYPGYSHGLIARNLSIEPESARHALWYYGVKAPEWKQRFIAEADAIIRILIDMVSSDKILPKDAFAKIRLRREKARLGRLERGFDLALLSRMGGYREFANVIGDGAWIAELSRVQAREFFRDLEYSLEYKGKKVGIGDLSHFISDTFKSDRAASAAEEAEEPQTPLEKAEAENQALRYQLESTQSTLHFIQGLLENMSQSGDEQVEAAKKDAVKSFFVTLNSETYGHLLDSAMFVAGRLEALRREHYRVPRELLPLTIIIKNLVSFIKGSGFTPILTDTADFSVRAADIAFYDYIGEPFIGDEEKRVSVKSPGWKFDDAVISQPVIREIAEEG